MGRVRVKVPAADISLQEKRDYYSIAISLVIPYPDRRLEYPRKRGKDQRAALSFDFRKKLDP